MLQIIYFTIAIIASLAVGVGCAYYFFRTSANGIISKAKEEAEIIKRDKIIEAKEKFIALKTEYEKEINQRNKKCQEHEDRLRQREQQLNQRQGDVQRSLNEVNQKTQAIEQQKQSIEQQKQSLEFKTREIEKMQRQAQQQLEQIAGISAEEAKKQLIESLKDEAKTNAMSYVNDIMADARLTANKEAKKLIVQTIQRVASETAVENAVSVFPIENDEVKGRIIGRGGRNIRALEAATGVEVIVDDTPEAITLSAFDPVRREIARLSLHQLVLDGRIHPARIEEVVAKVKKQLEEEIIETGKRTAIDLGIHGLHPELIRMVGRMKYRSSYG